MVQSTKTRRYGVKRQVESHTDVDLAVERLALSGFTLVPSGYNEAEQRGIAEAFDRVFEQQCKTHGGYDALREIDEHNTIRAPLLFANVFLELAMNPQILSLAERIFAGSHTTGSYILNQQNGIVNPGNAGAYNQGAFHRDLPYQHFISSRPLAINALYCIEPFTVENGATLVLAGSHRQEEFPSDAVVQELAHAVEAAAGTFLVLDCMLFHSGGVNTTNRPRRAVNHVYTLPFIKQQILIPSCLGTDRDLSADARRLLGFGAEPASSPSAYYAARRARL